MVTVPPFGLDEHASAKDMSYREVAQHEFIDGDLCTASVRAVRAGTIAPRLCKSVLIAMVLGRLLGWLMSQKVDYIVSSSSKLCRPIGRFV